MCGFDFYRNTEGENKRKRKLVVQTFTLFPFKHKQSSRTGVVACAMRASLVKQLRNCPPAFPASNWLGERKNGQKRWLWRGTPPPPLGLHISERGGGQSRKRMIMLPSSQTLSSFPLLFFFFWSLFFLILCGFFSQVVLFIWPNVRVVHTVFMYSKNRDRHSFSIRREKNEWRGNTNQHVNAIYESLKLRRSSCKVLSACPVLLKT